MAQHHGDLIPGPTFFLQFDSKFGKQIKSDHTISSHIITIFLLNEENGIMH